MALFENPEGVADILLPGVGASEGCFLKGDSGRGKDGLPLGLKRGLGARAPGPTDCENFGIEGVSGLKLGLLVVEWLKLEWEGVVGVGGNVSEVIGSDERLMARWSGRKMPEPGTEVVKYRALEHNERGSQDRCQKSVHTHRHRRHSSRGRRTLR